MTTRPVILGGLLLVLAGCVQAPTETQKSNGRRGSTGTATDAGSSTDPTDGTSTSETTSTDTSTEASGLSVPADSSLTYLADTKAIFDQACVPCHGTTVAQGAPATMRLDSFEDVNGAFGIETSIYSIQRQLADGIMPPGEGPQLTDANRKKILAWIAAGAPKGTPPPPPPPTPSVSIAAPSTANEALTGSSYQVHVTFANAPSTATYDVYYTTTHGATTGGTAVVTAAPVSQATATFSASGLPNGTYDFYAVLHVGSSTYTATSAGSVQVFSNGAPSVALTGAVKTGGGAIVMPYDLSFTASDPDGDPITIKLEYSTNSGSTWTTIVDNLSYAAGTPYHWTVSGGLPAAGLHYRVRATASDTNGGSAVDTSTADFAISPAAYDFTTDIGPLLAAHCASCHAAGGPDASYVTTDNYTSVYNQRNDVLSQVQSDFMPQGGPPLSSSDKDMLNYWVLLGAPQN